MVGRGTMSRARQAALGVCALTLVSVACVSTVAGSAAPVARSCNATVKVTDHEQYVVNQYLKDGG